VYDKTVRRRRAVLVLLVALSLILLTAYFGEGPSGRLHSVQRGFLTVISPIQDGANKALKPVRDLFGWVGDTLHAKSQRNQLRKEVDRLQAEVIANQTNEREYRQLLDLYHLESHVSLASYRPVTATVVAQSPVIWYSTIDIDRGTSSGVQLNDPVVNGEGLVGKVTLAASDGAQVSLITDSTVGVKSKLSGKGASGMLQPKIGDPNDLELEYLPAGTSITPGEFVITAGSTSTQGESLFPQGIPIGRVTSVNESSPYKSVNVSPIADLHNLDVVRVLTSVPGSQAAQLSRTVASLPPGQSSTGVGAGGSAGALASTEGGSSESGSSEAGSSESGSGEGGG
jgi:rod shape-determining protein MreC